MQALPRFLAVIAVGLGLLLPGHARADEDAQTAQAHKLYADAKKALGDKRYKEAAVGFEAASKLRAAGVALYTAAQAWELAGVPDRAADAYALALVTPKLNDNQIERCKTRLAELEKTLGVVSVTGDSGTKVRLDDHMELPVPAKFHGTPGEHDLAVDKPDGAQESRKVTLEAGKSVDVDTSEKPEPQPTAPTVRPKKVALGESAKHPVEPEEHHAGGSGWKTVGFLSLGAGVAALGGAALLGTSAKDAESTYKATPTRETFDHAKGLQTKTNIALIAGGVLTVAGASLVIWQSTKKQESAGLRVRVAPRGVWAEGRF